MFIYLNVWWGNIFQVTPQGYYENLIKEAVRHIEDLVRDKAIVILITPGSSRLKLIERLRDKLQNVEIISYRAEYSGIASEGSRLEVKNVVDRIKRGNSLLKVLDEDRRIVVMLEDTVRSLFFYSSLYVELYRELTKEIKNKKKAEAKALKILEEKVTLCYLPGLYKHILDKMKVNYNHAKVKYSALKNAKIKRVEGVSLKLLKTVDENDMDYVKSGVDAIRKLSPDRLGLEDIFREAIEAFKIATLTTPVVAFGYVFSGAAILPIFQAILTETRLGGILDSVMNRVRIFIDDLAIDIIGEPLKALAEHFLNIFSRKEKSRDQFLDSMAEFLKSIIEAKRYIDDERFETIVDEVAFKWGLNVEIFKAFVNNMYQISTSKIATQEELEGLNKRLDELFDQIWQKLQYEIESKLDRLNEEINRVKDEIALLSINLGSIYFDEIPTIKIEGGIVKLLDTLSSRESVKYIPNPIEHILLEKIAEIANSSRVVVLKGEKGIGKSTVALVVLSKLLYNGIVTAQKPVVVSVTSNQIDLDELRSFVNRAKTKSYIPIFYLDPSKTYHYSYHGYIPEENFINHLEKTIKVLMLVDNVISLVVLSNDLYRRLEHVFKEAIIIDADEILSNLRLAFLSDIIEEYSGCSGNVVNSLASSIATTFTDNYVIAAVLAANWLKNKGCNQQEIDEAIRQSRDRIVDFIMSYIWYGLLGDDQSTRSSKADKLAPLILTTRYLGPISKKMAAALLKSFNKEWDGMYNDPAFLWFTQKLHGTIRSVIIEIVEEAKKCAERGGCDDVGDDPRYLITQLKNFLVDGVAYKPISESEFEEEVRFIGEIVKKILNDSKFRAEVIKDIKQCQEIFVRLVGLAHTILPIKLYAENEDAIRTAKARCSNLFEWFTIGDEMMLSNRFFLVYNAGYFSGLINACEIVDQIYSKIKNKDLYVPDMIKMLGILAISGKELIKCLRKATSLTIATIDSIAFTINSLHLIRVPLYERLKMIVRFISQQDSADIAARVAYSASRIDPTYAYGLLLLLLEDIVQNKMSWAGRLFIDMIRFDMIERDYPIPEESLLIKSISKIVIGDDCGDIPYIPCLFMRVMLGIRLANVLYRVGEVTRSLEIVQNVLKALEKLEKENNRLVEDLKPYLELAKPFEEPEEIIRIILKDLRIKIYLYKMRIILDRDLNEAEKYAKEVLTEIDVKNNIGVRNMIAKIMFLRGNWESSIEIFRENIKKILEEGALGLSSTEVAILAAKYVTSFLAKGNLREALKEYRSYKHFILQDLKILVSLAGILSIYGAKNVKQKFEKYKRDYFLYYGIDPLLLEVLKYLYGYTDTDDACRSLKEMNVILERCVCNPNYDRCVCESPETVWGFCTYLIDVINEARPGKSIFLEELRRSLTKYVIKDKDFDRIMNIMNMLQDPLDIIEFTISIRSSHRSLIWIIDLILKGELNVAKALAEHWYNEFKNRRKNVPAELFRELASSLGHGDCDNRCKEAILKLFYYHI